MSIHINKPVHMNSLFSKDAILNFNYRNNSIKRGGGGLMQNSTLKRGGLIRGRGLIQKSRKYVAKGPKKRLEVLKNELDKMAIKLNHMKLDIGVIMQKIILKNF